MIIKRTFDSKVIDSVLKHDEIRPYITDDGTDGFFDYPINSNIYYLAFYDNDNIAGLFMLYPQNSSTLEVHINTLPDYRGAKGLEAARLGVEWVFKNTNFHKINGNVPVYNERALEFSKKTGFEIEGINKNSIMKDGKLYDQIYFGIER